MVPRKLPRQEMSCKSSSNLLDLPQPVIVQIAEHLSLKDLPSFVCACRELASIAAQIYGGRRVMDMRCFDVVTPKLCQQLILRFAAARLEKCVFSCSVTSFASRQQHIDHGTWNYDEDMMQAIVEHFLGNYPCNAQLITDLQSALTSEFTQWLPSDSSPRPIDVLAHCYLLEKLLLSQPRLRELEVDFEFSIFKVPASRGYKQHWHLMKPFLALEVIQKGCPGLERYMAHEIRYQSCTINLQHLQVRFLERCPRLKVIGVTLGLDSSDLELYEHLTRPMALERAAFSLTKRPAHDEAQQLLNRRRMHALAGRMPSLEGVLIRFKARGSLKECKEFLLHLSCVRSLCFHCDFNAGYPSFDIDEGGGGEAISSRAWWGWWLRR